MCLDEAPSGSPFLLIPMVLQQDSHRLLCGSDDRDPQYHAHYAEEFLPHD